MNKRVAHKSIVAKNFIKSGELFSNQNLGSKRPGDGISPMRWKEVVGRRAKRDFAPDEAIEL
jgi:N,N'-diacetyllegionaminate synthase